MANKSTNVDYLEFRDGKSNKFYAAVNLDRLGAGLSESKGIFVYGPIGRVQSSTIQAGTTVAERLNSKLKKGYEVARHLPEDVRDTIRKKVVEALPPKSLLGVKIVFEMSVNGNWLLVLHDGVPTASAEPPKPRDMSWADSW